MIVSKEGFNINVENPLFEFFTHTLRSLFRSRKLPINYSKNNHFSRNMMNKKNPFVYEKVLVFLFNG